VPDYSDPTPVRQQIAEDLREQIRAGKYAPGDRLPANIALAEHYGVATETIRSALGDLRAEKAVETRSTRGTYVTDVRPAGPPPDLSAVGEQLASLADLTEDYPDLRARVDRLEANLMDLYSRFGFEYPHGGEHDNGKKAAAGRGRGGR
jgi:DNA-binding FadR family transcriptional regulator